MIQIDTLALTNGIRVVTIPMPHFRTASIGVYVRTGSRHETEETNGISHFLEHMAFKGTKTRSVRAINIDAEVLGADLNAYTGKDVTAYFMSGLGRHAERMLTMLADIVCNSTLPADEIDRERNVILQEMIEANEDPQDRTQTQLDEICYRDQPMGRPILGPSSNVERFTRDDLVRYVASQYTGANIIIAAVGCIDVEAIRRRAGDEFSSVPMGMVHEVETPVHGSGMRLLKMPHVSQVFAGVSFPVASISQGHHTAMIANVLFGGAMSSPLVHQVRETMGLAYHVGTSSDHGRTHGRFKIEALTVPEHIGPFMQTTARLMREHADGKIDPVDLERAKNQLSMVAVQAQENPDLLMEHCVENIFNNGRYVPMEESLEQIESVAMADVQGLFGALLGGPAAISMVGKIGAGSRYPDFTRYFA